MNRALAILLWFHGVALVVATGAERSGGVAGPGVSIRVPHVHNLFRVGTNLLSGGTPEADAGFAAIARLGVKTIISVDGARPDVAAARRHGLRYVHLPIGYDGVPVHRVAELVRAAQQADGAIFVHCHHGQHRGPAAVAMLGQATAGWTTNDAVAWMRQAGTSPDYAGLYRGAMSFVPPDAAALARISHLPEAAPMSLLTEAMVAIDAEFLRLKAGGKAITLRRADGKGISPEESAKLLWEHLRELARTDDTARRSAAYGARLDASVRAAGELHRVLKAQDGGNVTGDRDTAFRELAKSCAACHREHRD